jgi:hypothetical protein
MAIFLSARYGLGMLILTIAILLTSNLLTVWLSYTGGPGLEIALLELLATGMLCLFLWKGKTWAKQWLIGRYLFGLLWAIVLGLFFHDLLAGLFEGVVSILALVLLTGALTERRVYGVLAAYLTVLLVLTVTFIGTIRQQWQHHRAVVKAAQSAATKHRYSVGLQGTPWKVLHEKNDKGADLQLVRDDGSAYGLFFPMEFRNMGINEQLTSQMQKEIETNWLPGLNDWQRHEKADGFLLTANDDRAAYAMFYKHFGNLGVYAIFWTDGHHGERLYEEVETVYAGVTAPAIKERIPDVPPNQIYRDNSEAVVLVKMYDKAGHLVGQGSGFNLSPSGLIVTNLHVILSGNRVEVIFPKNKIYQTVEVAGISSPETDLVLLSLQGNDLPTIGSTQTVPVETGDEVYVIGNPRGLVNSMSQGIVSAIRKRRDLTIYQITAPISKGSSGGPVFNQYGEVIGVANSVVVDAQNLNFSIAIEELAQIHLLEHPLRLDVLMDRLERMP